MLAGGLEKSIEMSVRESNADATVEVISINNVPVDGRRLAAAEVAFEVSLPQYIEEGEEAPTAEVAGGLATTAFAALNEAVAGDDFAALLATSMEEAAEELVQSGEVEEAEVAALVESVAVEVGEVVAEEPEVGEVEVFEPAIVEDDEDACDGLLECEACLAAGCQFQLSVCQSACEVVGGGIPCYAAGDAGLACPAPGTEGDDDVLDADGAGAVKTVGVGLLGVAAGVIVVML